jgi:iron complex outermembrane receptor protein
LRVGSRLRPGVTTFDVGARYRTKVAGKAVVLRANIDNLTNKKYWLATGSYATNAAGYTIMLSAAVDF